jgi:hypothetical protein
MFWWLYLPGWPLVMTEATPEAPIAQLPAPVSRPPLRHVFGPDIRVARDLSPSGFEQIERACLNCGAIKITVLGVGEPRAWRRTSDGPQIVTGIAPPCDREAGWPW